MLKKVISGGQTGADQAGLKAAKACGLETGGWLPNGCITLEGNCPELLAEYGMKEHPMSGYPARTEANVKDSDGTIRFAKHFSSAGEKCTLRAIRWFNRPYLDVHVDSLPPVAEVVGWIKTNNIQVLNIAGNSEQTAPGIGEIVTSFLLSVFAAIHEDEDGSA